MKRLIAAYWWIARNIWQPLKAFWREVILEIPPGVAIVLALYLLWLTTTW